MNTDNLYRWVTYSQSKPPLYKNVIAHDVEQDGSLMGLPRNGAYFEDLQGEICFEIHGTDCYESFVIPNKDIDRIAWLEPIPQPSQTAEEAAKKYAGKEQQFIAGIGWNYEDFKQCFLAGFEYPNHP